MVWAGLRRRGSGGRGGFGGFDGADGFAQGAGFFGLQAGPAVGADDHVDAPAGEGVESALGGLDDFGLGLQGGFHAFLLDVLGGQAGVGRANQSDHSGGVHALGDHVGLEVGEHFLGAVAKAKDFVDWITSAEGRVSTLPPPGCSISLSPSGNKGLSRDRHDQPGVHQLAKFADNCRVPGPERGSKSAFEAQSH